MIWRPAGYLYQISVSHDMDMDHLLLRFPTWVNGSSEVRFSLSNARKHGWRQQEINQKNWPEAADYEVIRVQRSITQGQQIIWLDLTFALPESVVLFKLVSSLITNNLLPNILMDDWMNELMKQWHKYTADNV